MTGNGVGRLTIILVITVKQETEALKVLTDPNFRVFEKPFSFPSLVCVALIAALHSNDFWRD